ADDVALVSNGVVVGHGPRSAVRVVGHVLHRPGPLKVLPVGDVPVEQRGVEDRAEHDQGGDDVHEPVARVPGVRLLIGPAQVDVQPDEHDQRRNPDVSPAAHGQIQHREHTQAAGPYDADERHGDHRGKQSEDELAALGVVVVEVADHRSLPVISALTTWRGYRAAMTAASSSSMSSTAQAAESSPTLSLVFLTSSSNHSGFSSSVDWSAITRSSGRLSPG